MKRVLKLSLTVLMIIVIMMLILGENSYAVNTCNMEIQTEKTELKKGEEFTANIYVSNIQSDRGVISLSATLEYDKESLTLEKMEGQNNWETPTSLVSYNPENGKIAITRATVSKNNEVIFKMVFKVKEESKENATIKLKNITIADGDKPYKIDLIKKDITVKEEEDKITSEKYKIEEGYISKIAPGTTLSNLKQNVHTNGEIALTDKSGKVLPEDTKLATGMILKVGSTLQYTTVVTGDVDGNGQIAVNDIAKVKLHLIEYESLKGAYLKAADMDYNKEINVNDLAQIKLVLIGLMKIK